MKVMIIRHAESVKNTTNTFSSEKGEEPLTIIGIQQATKLGKSINNYLARANMSCRSIYAANTKRAQMTAGYIAEEIGGLVYRCDEFNSLKNNSALIGISETEAKKKDKTFMNELSLSRAGIFNAYKHTSNFNEDIIKSHEQTAYSKFLNIILESKDKNELIVFIVHHSTLTDIVINISRKYYEYPIDFYGNINCELCHLFLFDYEKNEFILADAESEELNSLFDVD